MFRRNRTGLFAYKPIESGLYYQNETKKFNKAIEALPELHKKVISMNFGLGDLPPYHISQIGESLNMDTEKIRSIRDEALVKLKKLLNYYDHFEEEFSIKLKQDFISPKHIIENQFKLPLDTGIINISAEINDKLIKFLAQNPQYLKTLDPLKFEDLVATLFKKFGYDVELTKRTRDGGIDVIAIKTNELSNKYLIQCKHSKKGKFVGVKPVRELYGVKVAEKATKAILATTTYFTKDAKAFFEQNKWELEPRDYNGIVEWLNQYLKL